MCNFAKQGEILLTFNFKELKNLFKTKHYIIDISSWRIKNFFASKVEPIIREGIKRGFISYVWVNSAYHGEYKIEGRDYTVEKGLLPITFIEEGYFQSEKMFKPKNLRLLSIKENYLSYAREFLNKIPSNYNKVFVHVRRGDYVSIDHWILGAHDFTLPIEYYRKAIGEISRYGKKNIWYIFLSDDTEYVEKNFSWVENKTISKNNMYVDFAIMTLCDYGILSNSSYSWWGAYLNKNKKENFIAPKYYLGFHNGFEYPKDILSAFPVQIKV